MAAADQLMYEAKARGRDGRRRAVGVPRGETRERRLVSGGDPNQTGRTFRGSSASASDGGHAWWSISAGSHLLFFPPSPRVRVGRGKLTSSRAHARAISAEMHSSFMPLRNECGMNIHRPIRAKPLSDDAQANIARIQQIWTECRALYGRQGPYLFGAFSGADAMYAPVIHRFRTYAIDVTPPARAYMDTMLANPAFQEWTSGALAETWVIERFETD